MVQTIRWDGSKLWILDQTILPFEVKYICCETVDQVAQSIKKMHVRGAPAIGVTAAYGMVLAVKQMLNQGQKKNVSTELLQQSATILTETRPTAVNLFWAIEKMTICANNSDSTTILAKMEKTANEIYEEDIASCHRIGTYGEKLLPNKCNVLTHCNAGALATAGYGTALGVIRAACEAGKSIHVFADETRPFLQGARLTVWELLEDGIDTTLIADNMAAYLMSKGEIDAVVVGADRIASNGDAANKIGTYSVALAAHYHELPFYIAAPLSTIDQSILSGREIPIEERDPDEIRRIRNQPISDQRVKVKNPAFDVTPNHLIEAIITDYGVVKKPYDVSIKTLFETKS